MPRPPLTRRSFLLGTALVGGGVAALSQAAKAFTYETILPQSALGVAFANRCQADTGHAALQAALEGQLAKRSGPPGTYISERTICPICGCPIVATRYIPQS